MRDCNNRQDHQEKEFFEYYPDIVFFFEDYSNHWGRIDKNTAVFLVLDELREKGLFVLSANYARSGMPEVLIDAGRYIDWRC